MNRIKELVDEGAYAVDPHAVAEAILRRLAAGLGGLPHGSERSGAVSE